MIDQWQGEKMEMNFDSHFKYQVISQALHVTLYSSIFYTFFTHVHALSQLQESKNLELMRRQQWIQ